MSDDASARRLSLLGDFDRVFEQEIHKAPKVIAQEMLRVGTGRAKRLRPYLVAACALPRGGDEVLTVASAYELLHTATLIHDDVIDNAATRRGVPSIHTVRSREDAILMGDYWLIRAAEVALEGGSPEIAGDLMEAVRILVEGEVLQQGARWQMATDEEAYYAMAWRKTGALFSACCQSGARLAARTPVERETLVSFGREFGLLFQICDDVSDYVDDLEGAGKPVSHDILEGSVTLPLILAQATGMDSSLIEQIRPGMEGQVALAVVDAVVRSGSLHACRNRGEERATAARKALGALGAGSTVEQLGALVDEWLQRLVRMTG